MNTTPFSPSQRLSAALLLVGQLLYIVVTQFHTGGDANNHPAIFAAYAASGIWTAVHVGQFAAMATLLAGLLTLVFTLDVPAGTARGDSYLYGTDSLRCQAGMGKSGSDNSVMGTGFITGPRWSQPKHAL